MLGALPEGKGMLVCIWFLTKLECSTRPSYSGDQAQLRLMHGSCKKYLVSLAFPDWGATDAKLSIQLTKQVKSGGKASWDEFSRDNECHVACLKLRGFLVCIWLLTEPECGTRSFYGGNHAGNKNSCTNTWLQQHLPVWMPQMPIKQVKPVGAALRSSVQEIIKHQARMPGGLLEGNIYLYLPPRSF